MVELLSLASARRIALGAQGFGRPRPKKVDQGHLRREINRLSLHQIDSVNVPSRAHYLPVFSRLGPYDRDLLDRSAWGRRSQRRLFEYWAHEASLLPLELHPLLRWRMEAADRGEIGWTRMRQFARERRSSAMTILQRLRTDGPMAASDFEHGKSRSGWWEWGETKQALEWLFWAGHITTSTRRGSFERVYDLTQRVIPASILALPTPTEGDAHRSLVERSAQSLGVATASEIRDYFRPKPAPTAKAIAELVEEGRLLPVEVKGWRTRAYLHSAARRPRRVTGQALLAPFDPLVWERDRTERLFGFRYRIEIYTPANKRVHGYYVLPFLLDEALVARVDLKADRQRSVLMARQIGLERDAPPDASERLAVELRSMALWLGLEAVETASQAMSTSATLS